MLTDASTSSLRRWAPGPEALKWVAALAKSPRQPLGQLAGLGKELGKIVVGRSEVAPSKKDKRFADPGVDAEPALLAPVPDVPGRHPDGRGAGLRRRPRLAQPAAPGVPRRERPRRPRPLEPADQPGGAEGRDRDGWPELRPRCPPAGARPTPPPPHPGDGGQQPLHHRREHRGHRGRGRPAHARHRADPVPAADRDGARAAAAPRPADDQQVLHRGPRRGPQHDPVLPRRGPAGLRHQLAQPDRRAPGLGPRHLRPGRPRFARGGRDHHRPRFW